jgi:hypothetical protein
MYARGFGVTKDYEKALEWYRKAAAGGSAMAENNIGIFYLKGLGIPRDRQEAIKWFRQAAAHGDPDALRNLKSLGINKYAAGEESSAAPGPHSDDLSSRVVGQWQGGRHRTQYLADGTFVVDPDLPFAKPECC